MNKQKPISKSVPGNAVYDVCNKTALGNAHKLGAKLGCNVYLKREDLQPVHSFKLRGAYNKISSLTKSELSRGVIAASAGNHAQGVALSASKLGGSALIVMPTTTPQIKIDAVKSFGAEVVLFGDNYSEAYEHCLKLIKETGRCFIHPFDDPLVIEGQGTIADEILSELPECEYLFVPIGGGGLIAGVASRAKQINPQINIIGVQPEDSNAMQVSVRQNKRVTLDHVGIFSDGVAVKQVGELTLKITKKYVDNIITVSVDEVCAAIKDIYEDTRAIVEPAGALSVAGANKLLGTKTKQDQSLATKPKNVACILSGANLSFERLQFIAERTLTGSGKEALFAIELPETPGALKQLCQEIINGFSISEFSYRYSSKAKATIFIGLNLPGPDDKPKVVDSLNQYNYKFWDLTLDELTKEHIRHMIGGKPAETLNEIILEVNFPEKPGALLKFLDTVSDRWNISLFHYRGMGADNGRVLIGFRCDNWNELRQSIEATGYEYTRPKSVSLSAFL